MLKEFRLLNDTTALTVTHGFKKINYYLHKFTKQYVY